MTARNRRNALRAVFVMALIGAASAPAATAGIATAPTTATSRPSDAQLRDLIKLLGDEQFQRRAMAATELTALGEWALPSVQKATADRGAQKIASRARAVAARIQTGGIPGGPLKPRVGGHVDGRDFAATGSAQGTSLSVTDSGRRIHIVQTRTGAEVSITAGRDDDEACAEFYFRAPEELRRTCHQAFVAWLRWGGNADTGSESRNLIVLREQMGWQLRLANLAPAQQQRLLDRLDRLDRLASGEADGDPDDVEHAFEDECDHLREDMDAMKLVGPGGLLPLPKAIRLGVSISQEENRLLISDVPAGSRAARLGIERGDLIWRVNGEPVTTVEALRQLILDSAAPLTIDVKRYGEERRLIEPR